MSQTCFMMDVWNMKTPSLFSNTLISIGVLFDPPRGRVQVLQSARAQFIIFVLITFSSEVQDQVRWCFLHQIKPKRTHLNIDGDADRALWRVSFLKMIKYGVLTAAKQVMNEHRHNYMNTIIKPGSPTVMLSNLSRLSPSNVLTLLIYYDKTVVKCGITLSIS